MYPHSILASHGYKLTKPRRRLLDTLTTIHKPLNPYQLLALNPHPSIDISTVYRNLELFEKIGIVHKIHGLGGYILCSHDHQVCTKVHDVVVCTLCKNIIETHLDPIIKKTLGLGSGPAEIAGICIKCEESK